MLHVRRMIGSIVVRRQPLHHVRTWAYGARTDVSRTKTKTSGWHRLLHRRPIAEQHWTITRKPAVQIMSRSLKNKIFSFAGNCIIITMWQLPLIYKILQSKTSVILYFILWWRVYHGSMVQFWQFCMKLTMTWSSSFPIDIKLLGQTHPNYQQFVWG